MSDIKTCPACVQRGTRGSCAPLRCYCGHEPCPAFASYIEPRAADIAASAPKRRKSSWDNREESTWIDQL